MGTEIRAVAAKREGSLHRHQRWCRLLAGGRYPRLGDSRQLRRLAETGWHAPAGAVRQIANQIDYARSLSACPRLRLVIGWLLTGGKNDLDRGVAPTELR